MAVDKDELQKHDRIGARLLLFRNAEEAGRRRTIRGVIMAGLAASCGKDADFAKSGTAAVAVRLRIRPSLHAVVFALHPANCSYPSEMSEPPITLTHRPNCNNQARRRKC
jgi:hypothetical protein